jgi:phospholipid/cholesterol/gamma-HCH transport system permease protein
MKQPLQRVLPYLFPQTRRFIAWVSGPFLELLETIGFTVLDGRHTFTFLIRGHWGWRNVLKSLSFVGNDTLPVALLLTGCVGTVLSLQIAKDMVNQGGMNYVGALVAMAMVRELGPIMTGFSTIAMAGSAFAAEITVMKSNSQLDALKVLRVNPVRYLMLPRVLATLIALPLLTVLGTALGIYGGMFTAQFMADVPHGTYLESVKGFITMKDIGVLLLKSGIFAIVISMLCCSIGFTSSRRVNESARSVTKAVVWSFIAMVTLDYFISFIFY